MRWTLGIALNIFHYIHAIHVNYHDQDSIFDYHLIYGSFFFPQQMFWELKIYAVGIV